MNTKNTHIITNTTMKNTSIFIAGCARDCQNTIVPLLKKLQVLGNLFKDYYICIVENDSKDATRKILEQAQNNNEKIILPNFTQYLEEKKIQRKKSREQNNDVYKQDRVQYTAQRGNDSSEQKQHMQERVMRIALARDCYLDTFSASNFTADYILSLDFDLIKFSIKGIINSIELLMNWDVLTANGISVSRQSYFLPVYYDSYALDMPDYDNKGFSWQAQLQSIVTKSLHSLRKTSAYNQVLPVHSAFAGLALYKAHLLRSVRYVTSCEKDKFMYCEHVSLHRQLREKYNAKIAINPHMLAYVSSYGSLFKKAISKIFPRYNSNY